MCMQTEIWLVSLFNGGSFEPVALFEDGVIVAVAGTMHHDILVNVRERVVHVLPDRLVRRVLVDGESPRLARCSALVCMRLPLDHVVVILQLRVYVRQVLDGRQPHIDRREKAAHLLVLLKVPVLVPLHERAADLAGLVVVVDQLVIGSIVRWHLGHAGAAADGRRLVGAGDGRRRPLCWRAGR